MLSCSGDEERLRSLQKPPASTLVAAGRPGADEPTPNAITLRQLADEGTTEADAASQASPVLIAE